MKAKHELEEINGKVVRAKPNKELLDQLQDNLIDRAKTIRGKICSVCRRKIIENEHHLQIENWKGLFPKGQLIKTNICSRCLDAILKKIKKENKRNKITTKLQAEELTEAL